MIASDTARGRLVPRAVSDSAHKNTAPRVMERDCTNARGFTSPPLSRRSCLSPDMETREGPTTLVTGHQTPPRPVIVELVHDAQDAVTLLGPPSTCPQLSSTCSRLSRIELGNNAATNRATAPATKTATTTADQAQSQMQLQHQNHKYQALTPPTANADKTQQRTHDGT